MFGPDCKAGPRPTLPPGGRFGEVMRSMRDISSFEREVDIRWCDAPTQGRARPFVPKL